MSVICRGRTGRGRTEGEQRDGRGRTEGGEGEVYLDVKIMRGERENRHRVQDNREGRASKQKKVVKGWRIGFQTSLCQDVGSPDSRNSSLSGRDKQLARWGARPTNGGREGETNSLVTSSQLFSHRSLYAHLEALPHCHNPPAQLHILLKNNQLQLMTSQMPTSSYKEVLARYTKGREVAVKCLKPGKSQGDCEFQNEIVTLRQIHH
ncbi:hypothetical protein CKAN_01737500 [Cinnamomum micranthum f. kanehirae]|uniref:Uncharacterized protein n=1 Tax=Cinnamomum micranthum f. kanehirae TaxID=337451 RepID=A0A443PC75_9MAGN|nr:hypothetical protein CKAN_01737500 [Cinnamomum micranthum f. kanehirae]